VCQHETQYEKIGAVFLISRFASAAAFLAISAFAAQNAGAQPQFEAASVKRTNQCAFENSITTATVSLKGDPLMPILVGAFKMPKEQIAGPAWLNEDCFEIFGKRPEGSIKEQIASMLQALLTERFKLAFHMEERTRDVYALIVDKNGPKMKESAPAAFMRGQTGQTLHRASSGISGFKGSMTMATVARLLSGKGYGPVPDMTGLTGKYDVDLSWVPDRSFEPMGAFASASEAARPNASFPNAPTADLFAAVRESLGLKLEKRKAQVQTLVIDHIERVPTDN
jgi:uncharacterized protein (TIGR03435 family)